MCMKPSGSVQGGDRKSKTAVPVSLSVPNWSEGLPLLVTPRVVLRELRRADAAALWRLTNAPDVAEYLWPGPPTVEAFEKFISFAWRERTGGKYACFAVVPWDQAEPAGILELRSLQPKFYRAELGLLLDPAMWDNGVFGDAMRLMCGFAFDTIGTQRIEVRSHVADARCNSALETLGLQKEATLRAAYVCNGRTADQYLWSVVRGLDRLASAS